MDLTVNQKHRALEVLKEMTESGAPTVVTAREATMLAERYGVVINTSWSRIIDSEKNCFPVALAAVATNIAKLESTR